VRRLQILDWLRGRRKYFREQTDRDLIEDGVGGLPVAEKLKASALTLSEHMRVLTARPNGCASVRRYATSRACLLMQSAAAVSGNRAAGD
jgi:hypothetical protein